MVYEKGRVNMINELTKWITENPVVTTWITIISLVGVVGTLIALILQIKDKKKKAIFYTLSTTVLVDNEVSKIEGIKILFNDEPVSTVVISGIKLWNGGNEILEENSFYPEHKLKIQVPEKEKILAATVIEETEDTCNVKVQLSEQKTNEAELSFYCLEPRQGATINVYHTSAEEGSINIDGKIKGGKIANKTIEVAMEDGEMYMSTGGHKIFFDGMIFNGPKQIISVFNEIFGISIVKTKKK